MCVWGGGGVKTGRGGGADEQIAVCLFLLGYTDKS